MKKENNFMNFITPGYDDLELSTQILIKEALSRGIAVDVLDWSDNFIRLKNEDKIEYIKQATRTSADTYISALIMENKDVTKKLLNEKGIRVPAGKLYHCPDVAFGSYEEYAGKDIVVKPNSTNFGEGVSIITDNVSIGIYEQALLEAFKSDDAVIIEEFISGKEFRFLVIDNRVIGVLHRVAANVAGDGINSVRELVRIKNENPLRGEGYNRPLEKIKTGAHEESFLQMEGKNFDYIPAIGEIVYLRKNSNISTGGDSIDYTDMIMYEYKEIAVRAAEAVGAKICGIDMIIRDIKEKPDDKNYGIIELNFNPAIHIHSFPLEGENRHAERAILDLLGFKENKHA
jgi:glutamate--cysteine ligase